MSKNKDVKGTVVKYGGKNIIVTKDLMQAISGGLLILLSLVLSGFFAFVSVGFDVSRLASGSFWLSYFITLATMYVGFFGVYVIREGRNKRQPNFVINNEKRRDFRDSIVRNRKLESCENWLKIFNYSKKVQIHKDNLLEAFRKLNIKAPDNSLDKNSRKYKRQNKRYQAECNKKTYIKTQLEYANKHEEIVARLKLNDIAGANEIKAKIGEDDSFKSAKILWRDVYFNDLFSGSMRNDSNSPFYNKPKAIWDNIKLALLLSVLGTALTTSMLLGPNEITIYTFLTIIANITMLCCYAVMAMRVADNVVFETMYPANEVKLLICNQFKEDDEKVAQPWQDIEDEPEDDEKEEVTEGGVNEEDDN